MVKNIIVIVIALGFIGSIVFLDVPMIQGVLASKKEVENKQILFSEKEAFIKTVERLITKYKNNEEALNKLDVILPTDSDVPNLLVEMEALANEAGSAINDINILVTDDKGTSKAETARTGGEVSSEKTSVDYKIVRVDLTISGDYNALKKFLQAAEENMRLIDVESITFSNKTQDKSMPLFDFNVVLKTYYYIN
jgi:Tfp pilus assembly protein PilO